LNYAYVRKELSRSYDILLPDARVQPYWNQAPELLSLMHGYQSLVVVKRLSQSMVPDSHSELKLNREKV
jgi:hypothetical protein